METGDELESVKCLIVKVPVSKTLRLFQNINNLFYIFEWNIC